MKSKCHKIIKHIPILEDHGHLYMYYGVPYSDECYVHGEDEEDSLILSYERHELCTAIAETFQYEYEWLDILHDSQMPLERIFDVDVETQDLSIIVALLLYLVESITLEDKFIDALNNGYLTRLLKRLAFLDEIGRNKSKK